MLKYLMLLIGAIIIVIAGIRVINKNTRKNALTIITGTVPSALFVVVTLALYAPGSIILTNADDFIIRFGEILKLILPLSISLFAILITFPACIAADKDKVSFKIYIAVIWGITLASYIQSNFLNPKLPELNGQSVDWSSYRISAALGLLVWSLCIILAIIISIKKSTIAKKGINYSALLLSAMQLVSLVVLMMTYTPTSANIILSKEGEFEIGSEENTIMFVLDSLGGVPLKNAFDTNPELRGRFDDFEMFTNNVAGGSYTAVGVPTLLTGMEYDPEYMNFEEYLADAWSDAELYTDLANLGYDVRLYTDYRRVTGVNSDKVQNAVDIGNNYEITEKSNFIRQLYKLTGYYVLPVSLKRYCTLYTDDITKLISAERVDQTEDDEAATSANDMGAYSMDDLLFEEELEQNGLVTSYNKAFRVYHLMGPHAPYTMGADAKAKDDATEDEQLLGSLLIVANYIDILKSMNLYENCNFIITADHGRGSYEDGIQQNSCLLVKLANEHNSLFVNTAPVSAKNIYATLARAVGSDASYGPALSDVEEGALINRLHTATQPSSINRFPDIPESEFYNRFVIPEDATDADNITIFKSEDINNIECSIGDTLEINNRSEVANCITEFIDYTDNDGLLADEFFINMHFDEDINKDIRLIFTCDKVFGEGQNVKIYARGNKVASITLTKEDIGRGIEITVPSKMVQDGMLPIRMLMREAITPKMAGEPECDTDLVSIGVSSIQILQ